MGPGPAAQGVSFLEITREPLLATACMMLLGVSLAWMVVARLIVRNYRKAALKTMMTTGKVDVVRPARDIWTLPPEPQQTEAIPTQQTQSFKEAGSGS